jgi:hypothetical protein
MKKLFILVTLFFFTIALVFSLLPYATGQEKREKEVILSTVNIDKDYEILGLVSYRSSELEPEKVNNELKKQARKMGADYVIGITYFTRSAYMYGVGTAVKLIKQNP